jgi:hypothetical protein
MKKSKELGKKNEGKEYKKEMNKDKAAKIITKEIDSRAKLNKADEYLQFKKNSLEERKTIFKRVMQYLNNVDYTSSTSTRTINGLDDFSKDELIEKLIKLRRKKKMVYQSLKGILIYQFL